MTDDLRHTWVEISFFDDKEKNRIGIKTRRLDIKRDGWFEIEEGSNLIFVQLIDQKDKNYIRKEHDR